MNSLWLGLALLSLLALAFIAVPVLRFHGDRKSHEIEQRRQKNLDLYNQRLRELDQEVESRLLESDEAESVRTELKRNFLRDMQALETDDSSRAADKAHSINTLRFLPLVLALLVPIGSLWLYSGWGASRDLALPALLDAVADSTSPEEEQVAIQALADTLQKRFERNEDDVQGGYFLGSVYLRLEDFSSAAGIFAQLVDKVETPLDQATILGQLSQAQYLAADQFVTPEVEATMQRALSLNPNEQAVMSLLAIEAFLDGDASAALGYWRRQLAQLQPGSNEARVLQQRISRVVELLPEEEQMSSPEGETAGHSITVHVDVSDELRERIDSSMRVFVFARSPAMPMPLAAQTFSVGELPLTVTLDESTPMAPGMPTLATTDTVIVGARISQGGQPTAQSGDFQIITDPIELSDQNEELDLVISEIVP